MTPLSHLDGRGRVRMVDVSTKPETAREAVARGRVTMAPATLRVLRAGGARLPKGNVLTTAHLAAVQAAKRTAEWIPLAHPLRVEAVDVEFGFTSRPPALTIKCSVRTTGRTGVEMEALTAVAAAGLTVIDMLKAIDKTLAITDVAVWQKRGGRSGEWLRGSTRPQPAGAKVAARVGRGPTRAAESTRPRAAGSARKR